MVETQENLQSTAAQQAAKIEMQERTIERLSITIAGQAQTISQLIELTEKLIKEQQEQATTACSQEDIISALQELQLQESKKTNLVVLKAPEGADEPTSKADDEKMALRTIERLSITIAGQAQTISQLIELTEKLIKEQQEQATTACSQEDIISALQELQLQESKKTNLAVLKAPEGVDESTTKADDEKMALNICTSASIPLDAIEKIFRHGIRKPGKSRPINLLQRQNASAHILSMLRRNFTFAQVLPRGSRIRRDLTPRELELEHSARKECYERKRKENLDAYYVDDHFHIVIKKVPSP
ncbi:hypothetical protein Tcan_12775 [Toxocara canis]|uniref:Uncharacterized protein n=1 Tax=Toxocara canis TaxID=6265 RepID=A0A0B2VKI6_TOXCA|nr:hypothetical protein Tcan_12775 [Toxocara canis]